MTTLTDILEKIYQGTEENKMMINQSSAFYCINCNLLLGKLQRYNIGEDARKWIKDYLSDRMQYVTIGTALLRRTPVHQGVSQGSVIGTTVFCNLHQRHLRDSQGQRMLSTTTPGEVQTLQ